MPVIAILTQELRSNSRGQLFIFSSVPKLRLQLGTEGCPVVGNGTYYNSILLTISPLILPGPALFSSKASTASVGLTTSFSRAPRQCRSPGRKEHKGRWCRTNSLIFRLKPDRLRTEHSGLMVVRKMFSLAPLLAKAPILPLYFGEKKRTAARVQPRGLPVDARPFCLTGFKQSASVTSVFPPLTDFQGRPCLVR